MKPPSGAAKAAVVLLLAAVLVDDLVLLATTAAKFAKRISKGPKEAVFMGPETPPPGAPGGPVVRYGSRPCDEE